MRLKHWFKKASTAVALGGLSALASTPALAADAAAQRSLLKELLPLFIAVAIPIFVIFSGKRDAAGIIKGIVVGVITFVVAYYLMAAI